jgi:hypothetical protein
MAARESILPAEGHTAQCPWTFVALSSNRLASLYISQLGECKHVDQLQSCWLERAPATQKVRGSSPQVVTFWHLLHFFHCFAAFIFLVSGSVQYIYLLAIPVSIPIQRNASYCKCDVRPYLSCNLQ